MKWTPNADNALDLTVNPDFSQVGVRHGADLRKRAVRAVLPGEAAVLSRRRGAVFDADAGGLHAHDHVAATGAARATGKVGRLSYTVLVADDEGGGSVICPGPNGSALARRTSRRRSSSARLKRDSAGSSSARSSPTARRTTDSGYNRVVGPDFQWRPTDATRSPGSGCTATRRRRTDPICRRDLGRPELLGAAPHARLEPQHAHLDIATPDTRDFGGRLSRRHRVHAAGGLSGGDLGGGLDVPADGIRFARQRTFVNVEQQVDRRRRR